MHQVAVMKFLVSLEKKVNLIGSKVDILIKEKCQNDAMLNGFQCQLEIINSEVKKLSSSVCYSFESKIEKCENSEKSRNIIIYGLKFEDENDTYPIYRLFEVLEIDLVKLGKISYLIKPAYKNQRSVCRVRFETLKAKKEVFRNCHKLKQYNLKVSVCDDLSFVERVFRKHILLQKRECRHEKTSFDQFQQPKEENVCAVLPLDSQVRVVDHEKEVIQDSTGFKNTEEVIAHSSKTIQSIVSKGSVQDTSISFEKYMKWKYVNVAETLLHNYKGEKKSVKNTLVFFMRMREAYKAMNDYQEEIFCACHKWMEYIDLLPSVVEKQGIKYKVWQALLTDLIEIFNDIRNELQITDEMDCLCARSDIEKNILKEIDKLDGSRTCSVD